MDNNYSAQDVLQCHLCDTPVPPLSCDPCHIYLCKACVGDHVLDASTEHRIVPIKQTLSDPVYPKCSKHSPKQCELYCEHCTIPICVQCASSKEHRGHEFVDLLNCVESKRKEIQKDLLEMESSILKQHKEFASDIQSQNSYLCETADSLKTAIDKRGEILHRQVEAIVKKLKSEVDEKKEKEHLLLKKEEESMAQRICNIEKCISTQKELQATRDLGSVFEYQSRNQEFKNVSPPKRNVTMPTFSSDDITTELLAQFSALHLTQSCDQGAKTKTQEVQPCTTDIQHTEKLGNNPKQDFRDNDDISFETFYLNSGEEIPCMFYDGIRYYLDDMTQEWQPFPDQWYQEGFLITNSKKNKKSSSG